MEYGNKTSYLWVFYFLCGNVLLIPCNTRVHRVTMCWEGSDMLDKEMMKGSIDILLLSLLNKRDMYGYEMVKELKENSDELYNMSEGTLYPALKRMENKSWVQSYWENSESGGRRKYYRITESGKNELQKKLQEWKQISKLIKVCSEGMAWMKRLNHT